MKTIITIFVTLTALSFLTGVASAEVLAVGGGCVGEDNSTFGFTVHVVPGTTPPEYHGEFVYVDHDNKSVYKVNTTLVTNMTDTEIFFMGDLSNPEGYRYEAYMEETNKTTKEQGNYSMTVYDDHNNIIYHSAGKREGGHVEIKKYIELLFAVYEEKEVYIGEDTPIVVYSFINIPFLTLDYVLLVDDYPIAKAKIGELTTFHYIPNSSGNKKITVLFAEELYDAGFLKVGIKRVDVS
jgi:hypothetical protein